MPDVIQPPASHHARASKQMESQNESDKEEKDGGEESSTFPSRDCKRRRSQLSEMEGGVIPKRDFPMMMMPRVSEKELTSWHR